VEIEYLKALVSNARRAEADAHRILAVHEASPSRVVLLEELPKQLSGLPVDVESYFMESIRCLELGCVRAGVVTAWCGFFEIFAVAMYRLHEADIRSKRPRWRFSDLTELKESVAEAQILDVSKEVAFIKKARLRVLQGHLATRNQCAHPTLYQPSLNQGIGYVDEVIGFAREYV